MAPTDPSTLTWTLLFKNHKSTTLLHIDPLQSFDSIKEELIRALRSTHPDGRVNGFEIPSKPSNVLVARPNDVFNLEKGFTNVTDNDGNIITGNETAKSRKGAGADIKIKEACPKAAGLKDGLVLAYKFRTAAEVDYDPFNDDDWDVILPSYEDQEAS